MEISRLRACFVLMFGVGVLYGVELPSNGTVFAISLQVPGLAARTVTPAPLGELDPLTAAHMSHWRCRYEEGRLMEVSRRDSEGTLRPMLPPHRRAPTNGVEFTYPGAGVVRPDHVLTPSGLEYALLYDEGLLSEIECLTPARQRGTVWDRIEIERAADGAVTEVSYWEGKRAVPDNDGIHARQFSYDTNGFLTEVRCINTTREPTGGCLGIALTRYTRGPSGEWRELRFFDATGERTTDWHGVSRYDVEFSSVAQVDRLAFFGIEDEPLTNCIGAHTLIYQYDAFDNMIGTRGVSPAGEIIYDGPALLPALFDRSLANALITREKASLTVPIWQFMDYSDLARAFIRWERTPPNRRTAVDQEQLRVLAEYLTQSRAGALARIAAYNCLADGLDDLRWLKLALLRTSKLPWPAGLAARTAVERMLVSVPTNAIIACADDEIQAALEYEVAVRQSRPDVTVVSYPALSDTVYVDSMRAYCGTSVWLPGIDEIRDAVRRYAEVTSERAAWARDPVYATGDESYHVVRGRDDIAAVNARLLRATVAGNSNRPVMLAGVDFAPGLYPLLQPVGSMCQVVTDAPAVLPGAAVTGILRYWAGVEQGLEGASQVPDWEAARLLHARNAAAQAHVLAARGATNAAVTLFGTAVRICPTEPEPYLHFAAEMFRREDYCGVSDVLDAFEKALPDEPEAATLRILSTQMCARAALIDELEKEVEEPGGATVSNLVRLAALHDAQGHSDTAMEVADRMLASGATNSTYALEWLTRFLSRYGRMEETERCLARLTELDPANFNYWVSRAALEYNRGRPSYGNQYLGKAAELDMARVRHLLLREGFIDDLREQGDTNLLQELEAIIGPTEGDDMEQYDIE